MDTLKITPKDFFLWTGAVVTLYVGVFNYVALLWDYINYSFSNPLATSYYYVDPYQNGISWEMATLLVLTPTFLMLMWLIRRDMQKDATRNDIWVRRWALFLTLFVAGASVVGDLIYVLYTFLNGTEMTTQFLLKALVVLLVAALGFMHFLADLWGYWLKFPARNQYVVVATVALVTATIIAGFFIVGTPGTVRLYRFDVQKVDDLTSVQYQIVSYYQLKQKLPEALLDLQNPISNFSVPQDAQLHTAYEYRVTGLLSFELCAVFNRASQSTGASRVGYATPTAYGSKDTDNNWQHASGRVCFVRTIDPQLYPPTTPVKTY